MKRRNYFLEFPVFAQLAEEEYRKVEQETVFSCFYKMQPNNRVRLDSMEDLLLVESIIDREFERTNVGDSDGVSDNSKQCKPKTSQKKKDILIPNVLVDNTEIKPIATYIYVCMVHMAVIDGHKQISKKYLNDKYGISSYKWKQYLPELSDYLQIIESPSLSDEIRIKEFNRKKGFVKLSAETFDKLIRQQHQERLLRLFLLLKKLGGIKKSCYPSYSYIYKHCRIRKDDIKPSLDILKNLNLISIARVKSEASMYSHNLYHILV